MTDDEHNRTMEAGAELYDAMKPLLEKYGLTDQHAPSLIAVAMGGLMKAGCSAGQMVTGAELMQRFWQTDLGQDSLFFLVPSFPRRN